MRLVWRAAFLPPAILRCPYLSDFFIFRALKLHCLSHYYYGNHARQYYAGAALKAGLLPLRFYFKQNVILNCFKVSNGEELLYCFYIYFYALCAYD